MNKNQKSPGKKNKLFDRKFGDTKDTVVLIDELQELPWGRGLNSRIVDVQNIF